MSLNLSKFKQKITWNVHFFSSNLHQWEVDILFHKILKYIYIYIFCFNFAFNLLWDNFYQCWNHWKRWLVPVLKYFEIIIIVSCHHDIMEFGNNHCFVMVTWSHGVIASIECFVMESCWWNLHIQKSEVDNKLVI